MLASWPRVNACFLSSALSVFPSLFLRHIVEENSFDHLTHPEHPSSVQAGLEQGVMDTDMDDTAVPAATPASSDLAFDYLRPACNRDLGSSLLNPQSVCIYC